MSLGPNSIILIWLACCIVGWMRPWIGFAGYSFFAVLCPQWNWRFSIPELEYQKFLAASTLVGFLVSGLSRNRFNRSEMVAIFGLVVYLALSFVSGQSSISPAKTHLFLDISWKITLMITVGICVLQKSRQLMWLVATLILAQGYNAWNINQMYFDRGFINVLYFKWNFLDNNTYSISTVPVMALSLAVILTTQKLWARTACGLIFVLQMHQLMLLESRGTMLGTLLMCGVAAYWMPKNMMTNTTAFIAVVIGSILAGPPVIKEFASTFESGEQLDGSAASRYKLWRAGSAIMLDYPVLGAGPWAGERLVPKYYQPRLMQKNKALHNLFFEVGTGSGIPALIGYLTFFWLPWLLHLRIIRQRLELPDWFRTINLAVLCGIPGYWASSMFSSGALIESPYLLSAIGILSLVIYRSESLESDDSLETVVDYETSVGMVA